MQATNDEITLVQCLVRQATCFKHPVLARCTYIRPLLKLTEAATNIRCRRTSRVSAYFDLLDRENLT
ncbi:hypothetical protein PARA125_001052 [Parachlamydia sp. AcF125]|nr:hypothetical protein [Parachlamydia sp. AcF125]